MSDKYVTFMVVPQRGGRVKKFTVPTLYMLMGGTVLGLLSFAGVFIFFDYLHVLSQVAENKRLRVENHHLKMDVQAAQNRLESLDQSVSRLKSFAQKLRVLGNLDSPSAARVLSAPDNIDGKSKVPGPARELEDNGRIDDPDRTGQVGDPPDPLYRDLENRDPQLEETPTKVSSSTSEEEERRLSLGSALGEVGPRFDSKNLIERITDISDAALDLKELAETEERIFAELQELFQDRVDRLIHTPSLVPARGYLSSNFGHRYNPFSGRRTFHAGADIANRFGTPIFAPADGKVTYTGSMGGFGLVVRIDHGYGIVTKYGHNSKIVVKLGEKVKRGDKISEMGSTGRSTGTHLHYQVELNRKPVNPVYFMLEDTF